MLARKSNGGLWNLGAFVSVVCALSCGANTIAAQSFDAPQARVLYRGDEYTVQAFDLYQGHLIVYNHAGGTLKSIIEVSAATDDDPDAIEGERITERRRSARESRMQDSVLRNQGLVIAGTDQRILGIVFDHEYMYVAVAGYAHPDEVYDAAEYDSEIIADSSNDNEANGDDNRNVTLGESETRYVRLMLHAYRHRSGVRHFSHEVFVRSDIELGPADLGEGPLEQTEVGVACFGWEFDFTEVDYIRAISPDGDSLRLPTIITNERMRSL